MASWALIMCANVKVNSMASISRRHIGTLTDAKQISAKRGPDLRLSLRRIPKLWYLSGIAGKANM